jgi:hypothetical protein
MTRKSSSLRTIYGTPFFSVAVVLPLTCYASGFPTVGGALLLTDSGDLIRHRADPIRDGRSQPASQAGEVR